jgi:two-component sensor histidine kinase/HAMP domain-containing protein
MNAAAIAQSLATPAPSPVPKVERPASHRARGSIFWRVSLLAAIVCVLTLVVFGLSMLKYQQQVLETKLQEKAHLLAASIDRVTANAIIGEDYETVVDQCRKMVTSDSNLVYCVITRAEDGFSIVTDTKGWRVDEFKGQPWNPDRQANLKSKIITSPLDGAQVLHYSYPFSYSGVEWGWIHIGQSLNEYHASQISLFSMVGMMAVPALLLGMGVSFFFARRLTAPILQLQKFAQSVAAGKLHVRTSTHSNDEVGKLAETLNFMTAELEASQTRSKQAAQQENRIREQDVLLKEIHHRVKNNMQILSSLLRMQVRKTDNDKMREWLKETESRIRSMGLIHEKLYQSKSLSSISFDGYVDTLVTQMIRIHNASGYLDVTSKIDIVDCTLGLDTALPCGLIINELVSNSLKYAFATRGKGTITVRIRPLEKHRYDMVVSDDGVGMPPGMEKGREGSLGTHLVRMLSEQLDGTLEYRTPPEGGTEVHIVFNESQYVNRV